MIALRERRSGHNAVLIRRPFCASILSLVRSGKGSVASTCSINNGRSGGETISKLPENTNEVVLVLGLEYRLQIALECRAPVIPFFSILYENFHTTTIAFHFTRDRCFADLMAKLPQRKLKSPFVEFRKVHYRPFQFII